MQVPAGWQQAPAGGQLAEAQATFSPRKVPPAARQSPRAMEAHVPSILQQAPTAVRGRTLKRYHRTSNAAGRVALKTAVALLSVIAKAQFTFAVVLLLSTVSGKS